MLVPLWASYLVKAFAWRALLGVAGWCARHARSGTARATGSAALIIVLAYLWLPYMIVPIYAGLERLPDSLLEASRRPRRRVRVHVPLGRPADASFPSLVAGSVFTFSLSLGDYIAVALVGGKTQMIGSIVVLEPRRRTFRSPRRTRWCPCS